MDTTKPIVVYAVKREWCTINKNPYQQLQFISYENIRTKEKFKIWTN